MERIAISTSGPVQGRVRPPGSKSITNRALVCAALADGRTELSGVLVSEDTEVMVDCLQRLGIRVVQGATPQELTVEGCHGNIPSLSADLYVANSGTTIRFVTALTCLGRGTYRLDGVPRMRERPIRDLLVALQQLGANVQDELGTGCPPVIVGSPAAQSNSSAAKVGPPSLATNAASTASEPESATAVGGLDGGSVSVRGDISSQFLSGLLMVLPYARSPVTVHVEGPLVSEPYVAMTLAVMKSFGVDSVAEPGRAYRVPAPQRYQGCEYAIEPDASAASYFWAAAAITGGRVTVEGLDPSSLQGDVGFCECLRQMGCQVTSTPGSITVAGGPLRGIDVNMNTISDTVQTLAAVALFAEGPTRVTGVEHNRHKETDRIRDLACELRRLGADVEELPDGLVIEPRPLRGCLLQTYRDHRMAMSLALVGLRVPGVEIADPGCTAKTYPEYFTDLQNLVQHGRAGWLK